MMTIEEVDEILSYGGPHDATAHKLAVSHREALETIERGIENRAGRKLSEVRQACLYGRDSEHTHEIAKAVYRQILGIIDHPRMKTEEWVEVSTEPPTSPYQDLLAQERGQVQRGKIAMALPAESHPSAPNIHALRLEVEELRQALGSVISYSRRVSLPENIADHWWEKMTAYPKVEP